MQASPYNCRWRSAGAPMPLSILTPTEIPSPVFQLKEQEIVGWWKILTTWETSRRSSTFSTSALNAAANPEIFASWPLVTTTSAQRSGADDPGQHLHVSSGRIVGRVLATAGRVILFRIVTAARLWYASPMENGPRQNSDWIVDLSAPGDLQESALEDLRKLLISGLARSFPQQDAAFIEDTTQVTLLRVLKSLNSFSGKSKFTTWAQAIALNTAFTELRKKRWQDVSLDALMANGEHLADPSMIADEVLGADEDSTRLVNALRAAIKNELTPKQRAAILGELHEMPFDQIAELLGTNRNAAYKLVHDARRALRKYLTQSGITGADIQNAFHS